MIMSSGIWSMEQVDISPDRQIGRLSWRKMAKQQSVHFFWDWFDSRPRSFIGLGWIREEFLKHDTTTFIMFL